MIRRYAPIAKSRGTVIPADLRLRVLQRDNAATGGCVGFGRFPVTCAGPLELDHVRASHGMGMKSETTETNLVALCGACHRYKTSFGREARPALLAYLAGFYPVTAG
jgi:5-methylcytosine-specific restriction endonuclease McrA